MSSSAVLPTVQAAMPANIKVEHEGGSDHGADLKTNPATPVKVDDNSVSPARGSTHNE
jgi:hypothetical protein